MKYVGSKNRMSKFVVPLLQKCIDENNISNYLEPFVGGANIIDKIRCDNKFGYDSHKELIALLNAMKDGYIPPTTISEKEYNDVKLNKDKYDDYYVGLVGFCATFGCKYFGGYARDRVTGRDIPSESIRNIVKQANYLKDITFRNIDFINIDIENIKNYLIYCDPPPYANTTKYSTKQFNHDVFFDWVRELSKNNIVVVSEYSAPDDFVCIWEKEIKTSLKLGSQSDRTEKLFTLPENLKYFN